MRVVSFKHECKCIIFLGFEHFLSVVYSGLSVSDGETLFLSKLSNVFRHFESAVTVNLPFQWQALDHILFGDTRGILQVYDCVTGELIHRLQHKSKGPIHVVDVSLLKTVHILLTKIFIGWEYTRRRVYCCCFICFGSECINPTLVFERVPSGSSG